MCTLQISVNRSRVSMVLERLLPDIERQREATEEQEAGIAFAKEYSEVTHFDPFHMLACQAWASTCSFAIELHFFTFLALNSAWSATWDVFCTHMS